MSCFTKRVSRKPLIIIQSSYSLVIVLFDHFFHVLISNSFFEFNLWVCDSTNVWKQIQNRNPCSCKLVLCWPVCTVWHCLSGDSLQMWTSGVSGTEIAGAAMERLRMDGKIRVDFLLLLDLSCYSSALGEQNSRGWACKEGGEKEQFVFVWHSSHYQLSVGLLSLPVTHGREAQVSINGMLNIRPMAFPARVGLLDRIGYKCWKVAILKTSEKII